MKRTYRMEDLDCANCAAKMERAIQKIDGVEAASVSFLGQSLTIEAQESEMARIVEEAVKVCKRIEPDCRILKR